jgi:hypothetical protein
MLLRFLDELGHADVSFYVFCYMIASNTLEWFRVIVNYYRFSSIIRSTSFKF